MEDSLAQQTGLTMTGGKRGNPTVPVLINLC